MTFNDARLRKSCSQFPGQVFISAQAIKSKYFVLEDSIDEDTESGKSPDAESFHKKWCFFSLNIQELSLRKLLTDDFKMLIHDLASHEIFVVEVDNSPLQFGDIIEEL